MSGISTPYYKALDFTLIFFSCSLAYWVRFDTTTLPLPYFLPTAIFAIVSTTSLSITNFYQEVNSDSSTRQTLAAISGLAVSAVLTISCLYLTKTGEEYSRIWLITSVIFSFISFFIIRLILKHFFYVSTHPRVITLLGANNTAQVVKQNIGGGNNHGITIARHFEETTLTKKNGKKHLEEVASFIESHRKNSTIKSPISEIWITHDIFSQHDHEEVMNIFDDSSINIVYIPELPSLDIIDSEHIKVISGIPTINSDFSKNQKISQLLKFLEDQTIAWCTLILVSPVLLIIALLIKLDSPGPIIFKQPRYGLGGKSFLIWKFRTMHTCESAAEFKQAQKNDPRISRIGKFLRNSSLDELPQLINVINGTMSIVGPRPHPELLNEQYRGYITKYMYRHAFKPGITGLAQIKGFRGETADPELMEQRVKYDLEYIKNWNLVLDIKILFLTVDHLFKTDRAY